MKHKHQCRRHDGRRQKKTAAHLLPPAERPGGGVLRARCRARRLCQCLHHRQDSSARRRPKQEERKLLARLLAKAAQISDGLQAVSRASGNGSAPDIEAARQELTEIRAALMELMGRKP